MNSSEKLRSWNLRVTNSRLAIIEIFNSNEHALTQQDVLQMLPEDFDRVTLYRTLKSFEESGLIHVIPDSDGQPKYALCSDCHPEHHDHSHVHFTCLSCKKTWCLDDKPVQGIELPKGFKLQEVNVVAEGLCDKCK